MNSTTITGVGLGLVILLWQLRKRSKQLDTLPGPSSPSFLTGHTVDLRQAPTNTRWNGWQEEHGATYKLYGPLMVRLSLNSMLRVPNGVKRPILVLGDPRGATHVLTHNVKNYPRPEIDRIIVNQWASPCVSGSR
jgi:hypothetical protein